MEQNIPIFTKIDQKLPLLTNSQKKVADYIIKNPMQAAFSTIDEIAKFVKTSTTTVVRLAITLDYSGYAELQKNLQEYLKTRASPSTRLELSIHSGGNRSNIISTVVKQQLENVNNTYANLSDKSVLQAAKKMSEARRIYVFGQRSCYGIAHYLAYNVNRILSNCDFIVNGSAEAVEYIHRVDKRDVVIVISMPRYVRQVVKFTQLCKKKGAFVIALSDGYASPFTPFSDILFFSEVISVDFHNAMTSAMFIADVLIGVLTKQNTNKVKSNLMDTDLILREMDINIITNPLKI
jgi:DNA-binding MurR/RpiR family transcriptional regulator